MITVVVPAHDEASIIGRILDRLGDAPPHELDVVVVANGCTDATAALARAVDGVRVVEIAQASKAAALDAALGEVRGFPFAVVDADVSVTGGTLVQLAERLSADPRALVASPGMRVLPSRSWWVRQYYRAWALTDYRLSGHIGSGVYMLSAEGRARFGRFPDVIADDLYVQRLFGDDERLTPADLVFAVPAPATLRALLRRNARIAAGNRQLAQRFPELAAPSGSVGAASLARRVWRRPSAWIGFFVYAAVYVAARRRGERMLRRSADVAWSRDETTRVAG